VFTTGFKVTIKTMTPPLRIAMFVGSFPALSETFILRQITGLLDLGHEVDVYADTKPDASSTVHPEVTKYQLLERTTYMDTPPEAAPWEMPAWPITGRTWLPGSATPVHNARRLAMALPKFCRCLAAAPKLTFHVLDPREYRYQAKSLSSLYRLAVLTAVRKKYDLAHAHFGTVGNSFRFVRALWKAPLLVSFHGYDFSTMPRKEGAGMYRNLFRVADAITVNSDYTRAEVEKLGCPAGKMHKLHVGLNPDEFPFRERALPTGEPVRLLTVARLTEIKGHEYVLRAAANLREKHFLHYDIAGDGPLRRKLEELTRKLGLEQIVTFRGASDSTAVRQLMADAHIFVLASVSVDGDQEGQGLALQEAQACGLPVLATNHGAFPEGLVVDQSGFLVAERDVDALTERLSYLIEHPEIWPLMGRKGRAFVEERYDVRKLNRQLVELYAKTVQDYRQEN
jgi:colanic acid/amylovoran biosynthesis glycosyltransferase